MTPVSIFVRIEKSKERLETILSFHKCCSSKFTAKTAKWPLSLYLKSAMIGILQITWCHDMILHCLCKMVLYGDKKLANAIYVFSIILWLSFHIYRPHVAVPSVLRRGIPKLPRRQTFGDSPLEDGVWLVFFKLFLLLI